MARQPEPYFPADYRQARRAFIAAAEAAGVDVIARVHPDATAPDGKPLFLDSAALGARDAPKALLVISGARGTDGAFGSGVQSGWLREGLRAPDGVRIVLVHALNPRGFASGRRTRGQAAAWPRAMLTAILTEDMPRVTQLTAIDLSEDKNRTGIFQRPAAPWLRQTLADGLPQAAITALTLQAGTANGRDAPVASLHAVLSTALTAL